MLTKLGLLPAVLLLCLSCWNVNGDGQEWVPPPPLIPYDTTPGYEIEARCLYWGPGGICEERQMGRCLTWTTTVTPDNYEEICDGWSTTGACIQYSMQGDEECTQYNPNGKCVRWHPIGKCITWSTEGECVDDECRSRSLTPTCVDHGRSGECERYKTHLECAESLTDDGGCYIWKTNGECSSYDAAGNCESWRTFPITTNSPTPDPNHPWPDQEQVNVTYAAYVPQRIRNGLEFSFNIELLTLDVPVRVSGHFVSDDSSLELSGEETIQPGGSAIINLGTIPYSYHGSTAFNLTIEGIDMSDDEGRVVFTNTTSDFEYSNKCNTIIIQTDKKMYKPGQTVKFRAVTLSADMLPLAHTMSYHVQNGENPVMLRKNQPTTLGVVNDEFQIPSNAGEGEDWMIRFTDDVTQHYDDVTFKVQQYKLPKFEVTLSGPSYVSADMEGITINLSATYTFGKAVKGSSYCTVYEDYYWRPVEVAVGEEDLVNVEFEGTADIFLSRIYFENNNFKFNYNRKVAMDCRVVERESGSEMKATFKFTTVKENIKVDTVYTPTTYKPGLQYTSYIKITEFDGTPLMDDVRRANRVVVTVEKNLDVYGYRSKPRGYESVYEDPPDRNTEYTYEIPPHGVVEISFQTEKWLRHDRMDVQVRLDGGTFESWQSKATFRVNRANSPSMNFLQISTANSKVAVGDVANFQFVTTEDIHTLRVMIMSRGRTLVADTIRPTAANNHTFEYDLQVTHQMQPSITILASYIRADAEVVADFVTVTVEMSLLSQLQISTSSTQLDAGDHITINITSNTPGSFVGIRAIDTSVLLLAKGNDVSTDIVKESLQGYSGGSPHDHFQWWWWWPMTTSSQSADRVYANADVILLSDAIFRPEKEESDVDYGGGRFYMMSSMEYDDGGGTPVNRKKKETRSKFPETWLWLNAFTDDNGNYEYTTSVPDTITSWELSAFSVSPTDGLGIADETKVTVFRNFFVNLNLPLKVVRGEMIIVQAIVFNYFKHDVQVTLQLYVNDDFEFVMPIDDVDIAGSTRMLTISADDSQSVYFPLRMTSLGDVKIRVAAQSDVAYDSLVRTVHVKPEGIAQCFTQSTLFSHRFEQGIEEPSTDAAIELRIPQNIVPGSASATAHVYGDVMGSSINNLGDLLRMPSGCGEQNMVSFAPDVFITLYLERSDQLTHNVKQTAYKHFVAGYQNQLRYKRFDGSFSAFGDSDSYGSVWLTAFVLKCFKHASQLEDGAAELLQPHISKGETFLNQQFKPDGTFDEQGTVSHRGLQGGVNSDVTMAAYVAIALLEVAGSSIDLNITRTYLENEFSINAAIRESPYELAIVTYALHLLGSAYADTAFGVLNQHATINDAHKYWKAAEEEDSTFKGEFEPCYEPPSSSDIETTAYALLTYTFRDQHSNAIPIVAWLSSQQGQFGGYGNTQDTVLGIQAMATMAEFLVSDKQNMMVSFSQQGQRREISLTQDNFQVYNRFELNAVNEVITARADGFGIAVVQLTVCYNINESPFVEAPFNCNVNTTDEGLDIAYIKLCCSLPEEKEPTGMLLYNINLPSGFGIDVEANTELNEASKKVEFEKGSANLYFDKLTAEEDVCANVMITRQEEVIAPKPATITVQDYYRPKRAVLMEYSLDETADADVCDICGPKCSGCPEPAPVEAPVSMIECISTCLPQYIFGGCTEMVTGRRYAEDQCPQSSICFCNFIECPNKLLPKCPSFNNALWHATAEEETGSAADNETCVVVGGGADELDRASHNLPAIDLSNRQYKPFLSCGGLAEMINEEYHNFSISFLVYVDAWNTLRSTKILSFGPSPYKSDATHVYLYKSSRRNTDVQFYAVFDYTRYKITGIPADLFLDQWAHVMIVFDSRMHPVVYVNGKSYGSSSMRGSRRKRTPRSQKFYLGKNGQTSQTRISQRQEFKGSFSSVLFWSDALNEAAVTQTYEFYEELLQTYKTLDADSTIISPRHQRFFMSPQKQLVENAHCYDGARSLSEFVEFDTTEC